MKMKGVIKMEKRIKQIIFVLVVFIVAAFLQGCGMKPAVSDELSGNEAKAQLTTQETTKKETDENKLPKAELVWCVSQVTAPDNQLVYDEINKYLLEKLNCTVEFISGDMGTIEQKFSVILASGEQADIMWTSGHRNNVFVNISKGAFQPIDDLLDKYGQNFKKYIKDYVFEALKVKGKLYAVPYNDRLTEDPVFVIRKDIVDSVGYDMSKIETIFDLPPLFDAILEKYPDRICVDASKGYFLSYPMCGIFDRIEKYSTVGVEVYSPQVAVTTQFYTEHGKRLLQTAEKWYKAGYFDPNANSLTDTTMDKNSGKLLGWFIMRAYEGEASDNMYTTFGVEGYEIPCNKVPPIISTSTMTTQLHAIPVSAKHPDRAMMVLDLAFSDEYLQNLINYGIKDKHYTVNENGTIKIISNNFSKIEGVRNVEIGYIPETLPLDYAEKIKTANESALISPIMGFSYDSSNMSHIMAATKSVWDEYFTSLAAGMLDYDKYYQEFVEKMEKAGIKELMADVQTQLDEYLASK